MLLEEVAEHSADDERRLHGGRQIDAPADGERWQAEVPRRAAQHAVDDDEHDAEREADIDILPVERARENALRDRRHERRLRRCERLRRIHAGTRHSAREAVGLIEQIQHRRDDERADDAAEQQRDLLTPRRRADEMARLEILHVVV